MKLSAVSIIFLASMCANFAQASADIDSNLPKQSIHEGMGVVVLGEWSSLLSGRIIQINWNRRKATVVRKIRDHLAQIERADEFDFEQIVVRDQKLNELTFKGQAVTLRNDGQAVVAHLIGVSVDGSKILAQRELSGLFSQPSPAWYPLSDFAVAANPFGNGLIVGDVVELRDHGSGKIEGFNLLTKSVLVQLHSERDGALFPVWISIERIGKVVAHAAPPAYFGNKTDTAHFMCQQLFR